ncbi:MAG: DNA translocase FtsK [Clostridia bacterium]
MAKAKRGRKKQPKVSIDIAVVAMLIISVLLMVLIYTKSGFLGETLSPMLGGIMGAIKYIIPIGTFAIAIYLAYDKKDYLYTKLIQYTVFLICISVIMSVYQISTGHITMSKEIGNMAEQAYYLGERDIGGGVIGTVIAVPLINLLGNLGTVILAVGIALILLVFMFAMKPSEIIASIVDFFVERKEEKRALREEERKNSRIEARKTKMTPTAKEEMIVEHKETARERRQREKEEAKRKAIELDEEQLTINLNGLEEDQKENGKKLKKYNHEADELNPLGLEKMISPNVIEANLFKQEEEKKEEKVKEVLTLEHTIVVEDENYEFPPIEILSQPEKRTLKGGKKAVTDTATRLQKTLYSFGVSAKVENVSVGPAITRYELKPAEGVRVSKIANLADDIALNLAAETIRIEAPIPGKQAVGIEVPNKENEVVHLREIISTDEFQNHKSKLAFALGKDVAGKEVVTDIGKMPHVLIAGATGSGKSVCINTLISSIIYKAKPSEVKLVMVDPKVVELSVYNGIPHLLIPVVTDPRKAAGALAWAVQEMENRYQTFATKGVRDLKGYNEAVEKGDGFGKLPQIVIIIDELADLMMVAAKDVEDSICRLAQKARAAGMHLVIATQRPSVDVITGIIKANIPSRISFAVSSQVDSRTILDMVGAEKLLGKGDMLFYPSGAPKPTRIQGAFVSDGEVEKIVDFLKANGEVTYNEDIIESIENANKTDKEMDTENSEDDDTDPLLMEAIDVVVETQQASTSFIQRRFKVGYARAGRIIDQMEERGVISGYQGSKPREVLLSKERLAELKMATMPENTQEE